MNTPHRLSAAGFLTFLVAIFLPLAALGGTTGKVSGGVLDQNNEPVIGANVILAGTRLGAVADIDDNYSILNLPPGRYDLQFRMVGYRSLSVRGIQVSVNNTTKTDATLETEAITTEAIEVVAQKPIVDVGLTSSVATITDNDIKTLPVQDLQQIVNLQAGVVNGHFRGGRLGEVQYQVNGVSVNNVYDNQSTVRIDRFLIQEVQVITGTFDAEYGQAMSGVVNTVLKSGGELNLIGCDTFRIIKPDLSFRKVDLNICDPTQLIQGLRNRHHTMLTTHSFHLQNRTHFVLLLRSHSLIST